GQFVAAGADIIIGSHPHVVQQHESINGVPVYYSLGNFVFDQYFEENVRRGLLLKVTFKKGSPITIEEQPIYLEGTGKTVLISPK
ncbi:MAG: CapA family protein, partial [Candidatus Pacebacteria bacterium]|nr:CapA family protein [Candidatus Paceibacterota bacterium]